MQAAPSTEPPTTPATAPVVSATIEASPAVRVTIPPSSLEDMATVEPEHVLVGDRVTITPGAAVQRNCTDIVDVYALDGSMLGRILSDDGWVPIVPGVP